MAGTTIVIAATIATRATVESGVTVTGVTVTETVVETATTRARSIRLRTKMLLSLSAKRSERSR